MVLILQNPNIEFVSGHHGWVSSHTLAIIKKATYENNFLGFTCLSLDESNRLNWEYFDRYPVFFSAFMNWVLKLSHSIKEEVAIARFMMNLIYLITMWFSYKFILNLFHSRFTAFTSVVLTFSGVYFMYYKDMIHYDQPALLCLVIMIYIIQKVESNKTVRFLYLIVAIIPLWGRGYSVDFLLLLWFVVSFVFRLQKDGFVLKNLIFKNKSFFCFILACSTSLCSLIYNIHEESIIRDVSISETSIVQSAKFRLGISTLTLNKNTNKQNEGIGYKEFTIDQIKRFSKNIVPYFVFPISNKQNTSQFRMVLMGVYIILILGVFLLLLPKYYNFFIKNKIVLIVSILVGPFWLFVMKNLSAYHDYTTIYYLLINLIIYSVIFNSLKNVIYKNILVFGSLFIFLISLFFVRNTHQVSNTTATIKHNYIDDIKKLIKEDKTLVVVKNHNFFVEDCYFMMCYYLSDYIISDIDNECFNKNGKIIYSSSNKHILLYKLNNNCDVKYEIRYVLNKKTSNNS